MENVGGAIVNKLSHGELFIIIAVVIIAIVYYAPRIRWNKGRPYINDPKYEDQRRDMKSVIDSINKIDNKVRGISIEMLKHNIYSDNIPLIDQICSGVRYIKAGYNSETKKYIEDTLMKDHPEEWKICWDLIQETNL